MTQNLFDPTLQSRLDLAEWLERLTANAEVATVLAAGSIPASSIAVESEGLQIKQW